MDGVVYEDDQWRGPWCTAIVQCSICTYRWVAVYPWNTEVRTLQCESCGNQNTEIFDEEE